MILSYNFILHKHENVKVFNHLKDQMFWSARLYNQVLQIHNEMYWNCSVSYNYHMMEKLVKQLVVNNYFYKLKSGVAQQVIKAFYHDLNSYLQSVEEYQTNPKKFNGLPKPPHYKKRYNGCVYTYSCIVLRDGKIYPREDLSIEIPQDKYKKFECFYTKDNNGKVFVNKNLKTVQFKFLSKDKIQVSITYETDELNSELDKSNAIGIDLGFRNLMTVVSKDKSFIYDGSPITSINRECNSKFDKLKSFKDSHKRIFRCNSSKLKELYLKRGFKINTIFHQCAKHLVNYCVSHNIGTIVIGYNENWKESISEKNLSSLKKKTANTLNRRFNEIPFYRLIQMLEYLCKRIGIKLVTLRESFTSKCSALHLEKICKHDTYKGVRHKGFFKSDKGFLNADINGAINILRRYLKDNDFIKVLISSKHIFNPKRLKVAEICCVQHTQQYC